MKLYYSGSAGCTKDKPLVEPENVLKRSCVMLSYWLISNDERQQHCRFPRLLRSRRRKSR